MPPSPRPLRILFVAEAVTLAQVVRLVELARALDPSRHEVHFASARFDEAVFAGTSFIRHPIGSIPPAQVERAVSRGTRIYGARTLRRYLADDLRVLDEVQPDLVVGDLRWSLLVSAPLRGVPLWSLINAYWSPYRVRNDFPLPAHPIVRLLGPERAARYFPRALPFVFRHFAAPLNQLRRAHGLPPIDGLQRLLVEGDRTLYPDAPELVPVENLPATHHFLGPVLWAPRLPLPEWWESVGSKPLVYVTLGSSGDLRALRAILDGLSGLEVEVMLAGAGRAALRDLPRNVFAADWLPGDLAARRAALVISNGGSSTGYQALFEGRPVIGVPWNLDQYLAMATLEAAGAAVTLRSDAITAAQVAASARRVLDGELASGVERARDALRRRNGPAEFASLVAQFAQPRSARGDG